MSNKHLSITAAGLFALLAACSDNVVEAGSSAIEASAALKARVTNSITGEPVQGASVLLLSGPGKAKATDASGYAALGEARAGAHRLLAEKEGYASMYHAFSVQGTEGVNVFIAEERALDIALLPLIAKLEGSVSYTNKKGQAVPAAGAKVVLTFDGALFAIAPDTAEADGKGRFAFEGLPAGASATVKALDYEKDGVTYAAKSASKSLMLGSPNLAELKYSGPVQSAFFVVSYDEEAEPGDNTVEFAFSEAVDTERGTIQVRENCNGSGTEYAFNLGWSADRKTLKLAYEGLAFEGISSEGFCVYLKNLISAKNVCLNNRCMSPNGETYEVSLKAADLRGAKVSGVELAHGTISSATTVSGLGSIAVGWSLLEGAGWYEVYARASAADNKWVRVDTSSAAYKSGSKGNKSVDINSYYTELGFKSSSELPFAGGAKIEIAVLAAQSSSGPGSSNVTKLENADVKTVKP